MQAKYEKIIKELEEKYNLKIKEQSKTLHVYQNYLSKTDRAKEYIFKDIDLLGQNNITKIEKVAEKKKGI